MLPSLQHGNGTPLELYRVTLCVVLLMKIITVHILPQFAPIEACKTRYHTLKRYTSHWWQFNRSISMVQPPRKRFWNGATSGGWIAMLASRFDFQHGFLY